MKVYEIVNPSDYYTLESDDVGLACIACMLLGEGHYGLDDVANPGVEVCPMFIFGGDPEGWLKEKHGLDIGDVLKNRRGDLAKILRSVRIGDREQAFAAEDVVAWHDKKRSSMNDIGRRAWRLADALEEREA